MAKDKNEAAKAAEAKAAEAKAAEAKAAEAKAAEAKAKKVSPGVYVAEGKAVTTRGGLKKEGEEITVKLIPADRQAELIARGALVEVK